MPITPLLLGSHRVKFDNSTACQFCNKSERMELSPSLSLEESQEIIYNEIRLSAEFPETEKLFDVLAKNNLVMLYRILD